MVNVCKNGRKVIYSDVEEITEENLPIVIQKAMSVHSSNVGEINFLYDYYRGKQNIQKREKKVRAEINNRITENRANEIVSFKVGYLIGEPIQYVNHGEDKQVTDEITTLNEYLFTEGKSFKDKELAEWMHICGTSYRIVLPRKVDIDGESPFEIYTLDPRNTFVIYSSGLGHKPLAGVSYYITENKTVIYDIYTDGMYYKMVDNKVTSSSPLAFKGIPIVEYPLNTARLGAFEIVLPLLDALNEAGSNRMDGIEQFIQSLMLFCNCDIDSDTFEALKEMGALKYKSDSSNPASVTMLNQELNQDQTQTYVDYLYESILTICGMPNRNGGSSTSDTGSAVIMRDGWSAAEARAKDTELIFKESEKQFLRIALNILKSKKVGAIPPLNQIEIRFTRRNYENITDKANVLVTMLNNEKIHPKLAFIHCGLFADGELAYSMSKDYYDELKATGQLETTVTPAGGDTNAVLE